MNKKQWMCFSYILACCATETLAFIFDLRWLGILSFFMIFIAGLIAGEVHK